MQNSKSSFTYDYVRLRPKAQIGLHNHRTWELTFMMRGSGIRQVGNTMEPFHRGEAILIPPEIPHCWYYDDSDLDSKGRVANITVLFGDAFLTGCGSTFPELRPAVAALRKTKSAVMFTGEDAKKIISALRAMNRQNDVDRLLTMLKLLIVLSHTNEAHVIGQYKVLKKEKAKLNMIRIYVACNYSKEITLNDVVQYIGMNRSSFCVFFKKATGKTFFKYLNEYRIDSACKLLRNLNLPISGICYDTGFRDVHYFNHLFRKIKGCSPTEYRMRFDKRTSH